MQTVSVSAAKQGLTLLVDGLQQAPEPVLITRHGQPAAVLLSVRQVEQLLRGATVIDGLDAPTFQAAIDRA